MYYDHYAVDYQIEEREAGASVLWWLLLGKRSDGRGHDVLDRSVSKAWIDSRKTLMDQEVAR